MSKKKLPESVSTWINLNIHRTFDTNVWHIAKVEALGNEGLEL